MGGLESRLSNHVYGRLFCGCTIMAIGTELTLHGVGVEVESLSSVDVLSKSPAWGKPNFPLVNVITFFSTVLCLKDYF